MNRYKLCIMLVFQISDTCLASARKIPAVDFLFLGDTQEGKRQTSEKFCGKNHRGSEAMDLSAVCDCGI